MFFLSCLGTKSRNDRKATSPCLELENQCRKPAETQPAPPVWRKPYLYVFSLHPQKDSPGISLPAAARAALPSISCALFSPLLSLFLSSTTQFQSLQPDLSPSVRAAIESDARGRIERTKYPKLNSWLSRQLPRSPARSFCSPYLQSRNRTPSQGGGGRPRGRRRRRDEPRFSVWDTSYS